MSYWAKAKAARDQVALIATTLSDRIPEDHSVRLFWESLRTYDWRLWESRYGDWIGVSTVAPHVRVVRCSHRVPTTRETGDFAATERTRCVGRWVCPAYNLRILVKWVRWQRDSIGMRR